MDKALKQIISKMPKHFQMIFKDINPEGLQEIRFRSNKKVSLYYNDGVAYLDEVTKGVDIENIVSSFCSSSVYAHFGSIVGGFITLPGGHRVGIAGRAVYKDGKLSNIHDFSGLNIRLAREYKGCADSVTDKILRGGRILNTLVISEPNGGKTTFLRDIARYLGKNHKVVIVDERSEIAAVKSGVFQFDVGENTDVLDGFLKNDGIVRALRSLSPDVIITDEIGTKEDLCAIQNILKGGVKIITSIHAENFDDVKRKKGEFVSLFDLAIVLERREVRECIDLQE